MIRVEVDAEDVTAYYELLSARHKDMTPLTDRVSFAMAEEVAYHLATDEFAPLSEDYAEWKEVHFPGQPILHATEAMAESILPAFDQFYAEAAPNVFYALYHVSREPHPFMPERQFVYLTPEFTNTIVETSVDWLVPVE